MSTFAKYIRDLEAKSIIVNDDINFRVSCYSRYEAPDGSLCNLNYEGTFNNFVKLPNVTGTVELASLTGAQTFSDKTLDSTCIFPTTPFVKIKNDVVVSLPHNTSSFVTADDSAVVTSQGSISNNVATGATDQVSITIDTAGIYLITLQTSMETPNPIVETFNPVLFIQKNGTDISSTSISDYTATESAVSGYGSVNSCVESCAVNDELTYLIYQYSTGAGSVNLQSTANYFSTFSAIKIGN